MSSQPPRRVKRSKYLVDPKFQLTLAAQLLAVLVGVGVLYVVGLFMLPASPDFSKLTGAEVGTLLLRATAIYFGLGAVILGLAVVVLMSRVAGPAFSVRRALESFRRRDYSHQVVLRRRDYLRALAGSVEELRLQLVADRDERSRLVADLGRCLEESDVAGARELVAQLQGDCAAQPEPAEV